MPHKTAEQARQNAAAVTLPSLSPQTMTAVTDVYQRLIREHVHGSW